MNSSLTTVMRLVRSAWRLTGMTTLPVVWRHLAEGELDHVVLHGQSPRRRGARAVAVARRLRLGLRGRRGSGLRVLLRRLLVRHRA
jgi:hypothetical protein